MVLFLCSSWIYNNYLQDVKKYNKKSDNHAAVHRDIILSRNFKGNWLGASGIHYDF